MSPHRCPATSLARRKVFAARLSDRLAAARARCDDDGMTTAEYAVGTLAACGFAGVLLRVVTSSGVHDALAGLLARALASAG